MDLFRRRLHNILKQLTLDQREELMEKLFEKPQFQPKGYPFNYNSKSFEELSDEEVKFLHGSFIDIQFSDDPTLQGEDIRNVIIYPFKKLNTMNPGSTVKLFLKLHGKEILSHYEKQLRSKLMDIKLLTRGDLVYITGLIYYKEAPINIPIFKGNGETIEWLDELNVPELYERFDGWDYDEEGYLESLVNQRVIFRNRDLSQCDWDQVDMGHITNYEGSIFIIQSLGMINGPQMEDCYFTIKSIIDNKEFHAVSGYHLEII